MFVEFLRIGECGGASGASSCNVGYAAVGFATTRALLAAIGRILLYTMDRSKVALEHIGAVEALLRCRAAARTETTNHGALVVGECVSVLVVLPREALGVILASGNWALLGPLVLVSEHVRLEILEDTAAFR